MAQVLVNLQAALSTERRFLAGAVGYSFQARCAWLLEPELPYFVFGAEGATVDCGLVVKDDLQVEDDGTKRLFRGGSGSTIGQLIGWEAQFGCGVLGHTAR